MIYFITARDVNRVKIGYSNDPSKRLKELQTGCPAKCVIEATIDADNSFEGEVHEIFRTSRKHGEWFELTPEIEMAIRLANGVAFDDVRDDFIRSHFPNITDSGLAFIREGLSA